MAKNRMSAKASEVDKVREWLRKDVMTRALQGSNHLEALLSFTTNELNHRVSVQLTLHREGNSSVRFVIAPEPTALTPDVLRGTTPADEVDGYYWVINTGQEQKEHGGWGSYTVVPAINEFCTLHDALVYLQNVYGYNEGVSEENQAYQ